MTAGSPFGSVLAIALGIVMMGAGGVNFAGQMSVRESFTRWGYPAGFHKVTGGLEVVAGLLLLIPATSHAGAVGSVMILMTAMITLIRHRDWGHLPGAVVLTAGGAAVIAFQGHWIL